MDGTKDAWKPGPIADEPRAVSFGELDALLDAAIRSYDSYEPVRELPERRAALIAGKRQITAPDVRGEMYLVRAERETEPAPRSNPPMRCRYCGRDVPEALACAAVVCAECCLFRAAMVARGKLPRPQANAGRKCPDCGAPLARREHYCQTCRTARRRATKRRYRNRAKKGGHDGTEKPSKPAKKPRKTRGARAGPTHRPFSAESTLNCPAPRRETTNRRTGA